jgi:hypothetical protein
MRVKIPEFDSFAAAYSLCPTLVAAHFSGATDNMTSNFMWDRVSKPLKKSCAKETELGTGFSNSLCKYSDLTDQYGWNCSWLSPAI